MKLQRAMGVLRKGGILVVSHKGADNLVHLTPGTELLWRWVPAFHCWNLLSETVANKGTWRVAKKKEIELIPERMRRNA
jgi:hypothetical protein